MTADPTPLPGAESTPTSGPAAVADAPVDGWSDRARLRRAQIIEAAHDVFVAKGFRNGSLVEIAQRVGITHQGVLHYFGSKESLLAQVLDDRDRSGQARADAGGRPRGTAFLQLLVDTAARNESRSDVIEAYTVLSAESVVDGHPAQEWFRTRLRMLRDELRQALEEVCGSDSVVAEDELDRAASAIIAVMDGLQVQWLLDPPAVEMANTLRDVIESILRSWGLPPLANLH